MALALWEARTRREEVDRVLEHLGVPFGEETVQGLAWRKPYGYAGDFDIIERIHRDRRSPDPVLARWDAFTQGQHRPRAVRNRARYFQDLVDEMERRAGRPLRILDVACGPCIDVAGLFERDPERETCCDCVDLDERALERALRLCGEQDGRVRFRVGDGRRLHAESQYDLVWSSGLFDYFSDAVFARSLKGLGRWLAPGGRIVVGNFSTCDPTHAYMHVLDWPLYRRSSQRLRRLAETAGFAPEWIRVEREALGVNLFLQVERPA